VLDKSTVSACPCFAMSQKPVSAYAKAGGMAYFPRMISKIRLHAVGELPPDYQANLGKGADGFCASFLRVQYDALTKRVLAGGTDDEILEWCFTNGRRPNEDDLIVWNGFILKLGWNDPASRRLQKVKADAGLAHRDDIQTMPDFFDVDEGRKP
jgi:hypothetical protein